MSQKGFVTSSLCLFLQTNIHIKKKRNKQICIFKRISDVFAKVRPNLKNTKISVTVLIRLKHFLLNSWY